MRFENLITLSLLLAAAAPIHAQQKKAEPLTTVALFHVDQPNVRPFIEKTRQFVPTLDKLMADGVLLGYGVESDLYHQGRGPNVALWTTYANYTNLQKGERAIDEFIEKSPGLMKEISALHDMSKHVDLVVRSLEHGGNFKPGCETSVNSFAEYKVKPGQLQAFLKMYRASQKPVLDELVKDGTVCSYSFDVEDIHSMEPGMVWIIVTTPDMAAWDKVDAAFEAAEAKLSESERSIRQNSWRDAQAPGSHRDSATKTAFMKAK